MQTHCSTRGARYGDYHIDGVIVRKTPTGRYETPYLMVNGQHRSQLFRSLKEARDFVRRLPKIEVA